MNKWIQQLQHWASFVYVCPANILLYFLQKKSETELESIQKMLFADLPSDFMMHLFEIEKAGGMPRSTYYVQQL